MQTYNFSNKVATANVTPAQSQMSVFNSEVSDMFTANVQPLVTQAQMEGETFKKQKETLFAQFESKGITGSAFRPMYTALRELNNKKRTLKSVAEQFPHIQKKDIQELAKILANREPEMLTLLTRYQKTQQEALLTAQKQHAIYIKHIPDTAPDIDAAYEEITERLYVLDDNVRAGLKS